jgi:hypothetical protein
VGEQLGLQLLAPREHRRVVAEVAGKGRQALVEMSAHLVIRVRGDVVEERVERGEDLLEDAVVDGFGHPPR